jgi:hypothetical protein
MGHRKMYKQLVLLSILLIGIFRVNAASDKQIDVDTVQQITEIKQIAYQNTVIRDLAFQPGSNRLAVIRVTKVLDGEVTLLDKQH